MKDVTRAQFLAYVKVQESGVTNMFDTRNVALLSGLSKAVIHAIVMNYGKYNLMYLPDRK